MGNSGSMPHSTSYGRSAVSVGPILGTVPRFSSSLAERSGAGSRLSEMLLISSLTWEQIAWNMDEPAAQEPSGRSFRGNLKCGHSDVRAILHCFCESRLSRSSSMILVIYVHGHI